MANLSVRERLALIQAENDRKVEAHRESVRKDLQRREALRKSRLAQVVADMQHLASHAEWLEGELADELAGENHPRVVQDIRANLAKTRAHLRHLAARERAILDRHQ